MTKRTLIVALLLFSSLQISETEKCFLRLMRGELRGNDKAEVSLMDSDESILRTIASDYQLLPSRLRTELEKCGKALPDQSCELKFGQNQCEPCGLSKVRKCQPGFQRFDCLTCMRICPAGTTPHANGSMCAKGLVKNRHLFLTREACLLKNKDCRPVDEVYPSDCPDGYKPLGKHRCAYSCPEGFFDTPRFCIPDRTETPLSFNQKFEVAYKSILSLEN